MARNRLTCYCGNCPGCLRLMAARDKRAAKFGCRCGRKYCDCAAIADKFEEKHGDAMREYYSRSTIRSAGSSLAGVVGVDARGAGLGDGVATFPARDQWRATLRGEARASVERRELRRAA